MSGTFSLSADRKLRGWARLAEQPDYPVTVHLVSGNAILSSTIAEKSCSEGTVPNGAAEMSRLPCWFEFDLAGVEMEEDNAFRIVVGETGERLSNVADQSGVFDNAEEMRPVLTYRDALASGMSEIDVVKMLYLDILRRPIDLNGLASHRAARARGERSFERVRRELLASDEYASRRKNLKDAAGNAFRRALVWRSADAVLAFEPVFASFFADDLPLPARLIRYFPGLLVQGDGMDAARRDIARGLPEREIFQRALSRLAGRPALVIEPDVLDARRADDEGASAGEETHRVISVPVGSPLFLAGWHQMEGSRDEPRRWMRQIGVIRNPRPRRPVEMAEVDIIGAYADTGRLLAVSDSEELVVTIEEGDGRRLARITSGNGPFPLRRLVLISSKATSPFRHDGSYDMRCLSIQISQARFAYAASMDR